MLETRAGLAYRPPPLREAWTRQTYSPRKACSMRCSYSLRRWLDRLINPCAYVSIKRQCGRTRLSLSKKLARPWFEQLEARLAPTANVVDWADWKSAVVGQGGSAQSTITVPGVNPITVNYAGEVTFADTDATGGAQYWVPTAPYVSQNVGAAPSLPDIVALTGGNTTVDTVTFSQPVLNPILGIISLGNNGLTATYDFNVPFTILSSGPGFFGGPGTLTQLPGNVLSGTEGNGVIQFQGTLTSIQWTDPIGEYWSGFTVGLPEAANSYYPPVARDDHYEVTQDVPLTAGSQGVPGVLSNDISADNRPLTAALVTGPSHGTLTFNLNGSFIYTPSPKFVGSDSFTYKDNDGTSDSNVATVSVSVDLSTSISLTASQGAVTYGTPVTFSATVTSADGTPTGSVEFFDDTTGADLAPARCKAVRQAPRLGPTPLGQNNCKQQAAKRTPSCAAFTGTNSFFDGSANLVGGETVDPLNVNVSGVTANDKVYDGGTTASVNFGAATIAGIIPDDVVSVGEIDGSFASKDVGNAIPVTVTKLLFAGPQAGDYAPVLNEAPLTASITPAPVTVAGIVADKVYDGTTRASVTLGSVRIKGFVKGDVVSFIENAPAATFASKDVGPAVPVTLTGLSLQVRQAGDYMLITTTTAAITPAPLSVTGITVGDKTYYGTKNATLDTSKAGLIGVFGTDNVSLDTSAAIGTFVKADAGTNLIVHVTGLSLMGPQAGDYLLRQAQAPSRRPVLSAIGDSRRGLRTPPPAALIQSWIARAMA